VVKLIKRLGVVPSKQSQDLAFDAVVKSARSHWRVYDKARHVVRLDLHKRVGKYSLGTKWSENFPICVKRMKNELKYENDFAERKADRFGRKRKQTWNSGGTYAKMECPFPINTKFQFYGNLFLEFLYSFSLP
jgi:hypothetical protein